jgi:Spy/CpxP family protein refolding chaperone
MKNTKQRLNHILLAAAVALPLLSAAGTARTEELNGEHPPALAGGEPGGPGGHAGPGGPGGRGPDGPEHGPGGPGGAGGPDGPPPGFGPGPGFGPQGRAPLFRGVELTEAQEDKVFAILHAEQPYLRDQAKAATKAREALRALAGADKYDDAKAAALAQAAATAAANIELQHVRTRQKLLAVLTPEQRKAQAEQRKERQEQDGQQAEGKPRRPRN